MSTRSLRPRVDSLRARTRDALERRLGIDARALAAFRIAVGLVLLFDIGHRSRDLRTFYTDGGVLPRAMLVDQYPAAEYSIHALSGAAWVQALLFGCAAAAAAALLVGYRTRTATVLSLLLLVSVQARNPFLLNGADRLLSQLLFLAIFLPLGRRWAIDALGDTGDVEDAAREPDPERRSERTPRIVTPATAAMLVSVVAVFVSNALGKAEGDTWHTGEALHYALRLDHMTVLLGDHLVNYPLLLTVGTFAWMGLVTGAPLMILFAGRLRIAYVAVFVAAATGMALSMAVGLFPAVLVGSFLLFLPPRFWNALEHTLAVAVGRIDGLDRGVAVVRDATTRVRRPRPAGSALPTPTQRRVRQCRSFLLAALLIGVACWNVGVLGVADPFEPVDAVDPADHEWSMFAPDPSTSYGWYVVEAEIDGEPNRDVLGGTERRTDRPPDAAETVPSFRWRKYMNSLSDSDERADRFAASMCERARSRTDSSVEAVTVTYTEQPIRLEGEREAPTTYTVVDRSCSADDAIADRNRESRPALTARTQ
ncbi:HTTM domain-containing protein [Natrinema salaciae]|uniref:Vitamin K-dependent gamma-carboxylase n=1 Tax=Natrinema salaciae TaxID=1186196 RepID=A0A1H9GD12_9EURY|nr:HTTM domain-containing protein [Natrinema salaciae]SEQ47980.1 Vitamin K-dependent gamma-carboxylase [Natrinema salaciae]